MNPAVAKARFQLTLQSYPSDQAVKDACELIYGMQDKNLIASLSSVPYIVGRSFSWDESIFFHAQLKNLGITHSLMSNEPTVENMIFDPNQKEISIAPKKQKIVQKSKSFLKLGIWVTSCIAAYGVLKLVPVVSDKENSSQSESDRSEAKIEKVVDRVEYRLSEDISWKAALPNIGLNFGDAIRTFDESSAQLRYREGSIVVVRPKTLMVIGKRDSTKQVISLEDGQVQARLKASEKPRILSIRTPAGILDMISPKPGETMEARIDTSVQNGKVEIEVTSGKASLTPLSSEGKIVELVSQQKISGDAQNLSPVEKFIPRVRLNKPLANQVFKVDPQKNESLIFDWEDLGENAIYTFEILPQMDSQEALLKRDINEPKIELTYLDLGHLYWRVSGKKDSVTFVSETRPIHVQKRNE